MPLLNKIENNVKYYNIALGSQTYKRAMRDEQFKDLMIRTAIDAIQEQCSEEIDESAFGKLKFPYLEITETLFH